MQRMELYVIRHGIAEDAGPGQDDAERALTADGEKKLRREVKGLRELGWTFDRVLTSPWLRAKQTAKLLAPLADHDATETELLAAPPSRELMTLIADTKADHVAVVGHEPWLGELVQWLTLGDPHRDALVLKKGGVAWLSGTPLPGAMKLRALLPPRVIRAVR
jgi:phosphohistidine phosphatase